MGNYQPSGKFSPAAVIVAPALWGSCAGIGAAYQWVLLINPYGILNPLFTVIAAVAMGFVAVGFMRVAKVRSGGKGALIGLGAGAAFIAGGFWLAYQRDPSTTAFMDYLAKRRAEGVPLLGGAWKATGGWMWLAWILEAFVAILAGVIPGGIEGSRPFCEACGSWARRGRWTFSMVSPGPAVVDSMKDTTRPAAVIGHRPGTGGMGGADRLEYKVGSCRCGRMATVAVEVKSPAKKQGEPAGTTPVVADLVLTRKEAERLFSWAESIDARLIGKRPTLALEQTQKDREPFTLAPKPEGEEYGSWWRWSGAVGATDSGCDNEYTRELRKRLKAGDFEAAEEALRAQRNAEDLAFVAEACAEWEGRPVWMDDWGDAKPDSTAMLLVRGINGVKWGWQARGVGWVPKHYELFQARLRMAEPDLMAAAERAGRDPTAWAWLIYSAKGLGVPRSVTEQRLREVVKRSPHHRMAHSTMLQYLCAKWHGSDEEMFAFARRVSGAAPAGAHVHVVLAEAHIEASGAVHREKGKAAAGAYWSDAAVKAELLRANEKCFGGHKVTMDTHRTRSYFAYVLWKAGERDAAATHLKVLKGTTPWGPWSAPVLVFGETLAKACRQCGV